MFYSGEPNRVPRSVTLTRADNAITRGLDKFTQNMGLDLNRLEKMENPKAESCKTPRENSQPKKRFST